MVYGEPFLTAESIFGETRNLFLAGREYSRANVYEFVGAGRSGFGWRKTSLALVSCC